jgi:hypothetical protein
MAGTQVNLSLKDRAKLISRSFNRLEVDLSSMKIRKSSEQKDKLEKEVNFYKYAPSDIKNLMPSLFGHSEDYSWYEIEYIDAPTLGREYILNSIPSETWELIFSYLDRFLIKYIDRSAESGPGQLYDVLINKAINRSNQIEDPVLRSIFFDGCTINGKPYLPLNSLLRGKSEILFRVPLTVGLLHGDLCFSNILYGDGGKIIKFIDPRGGFTEPAIDGPTVYDIAKIAQSVVGGYEQLLYKRYSLILKEDNYLMVLEKPVNYERVLPIYEEFIGQFGVSVADSYVLAGLMLAGTPLLHMEDPDRAKALALQSVLLLSGDVQWK